MLDDLLAAILEHDADTHRHLLSVGALVGRMALAAGITGADARLLTQAGRFHDIGKLEVERRLLRCSAPLDDDDWEALRGHAEAGDRLLRAAGAHRLAAIVRGHHERLNGSGYPDGLRGTQIRWETRLLAVADAYDAMRAGRPYAAPIGHDDALERLAAPHLYDPDALGALIATLDAMPYAAREATGALS